ncbi:golgin subfamily A member 6-like protein 25 [Prorops nasuta]|uniref:golgin subfamily A member 6-like protein 25 n=1 Tax=Prorops nasuta TaxID=863751 RepID=UPI0034CD454E
MVETWMEEKGWKGVSKRVPRGYRWWKQWAKKEERKGRAKGGILIGVREELGGKEEGEEGRHEGIMEIGIKIEEEEWRIIALYVGKGMRSIEEGIKRAIEGGQGKRCLVGGDWNARIRELGGEGEEGEEMEEKRRSKDKVVNAEGMRMMDIIGEMGMEVWNGKVEGDREGEFTYVGHMGRSVIDYVVGDREARMGVKEIEVEVRTESDHLPIVVRLGRKKRRRGRKMEKAGIRREWKEELVEEFRKKVEGMEEGEGEGVKERWEDLQEKMRGIVEGIKGKQKGGKENKRGWWDEECREKKKELRGEMRRWLRGESKKEDYRKKKKQYMERCEEKRGKWREEWSKEIGKARGEKEIWEIIKRCRGKEESRVEEIRMDEWDEYFREMLEGKKGEKHGKEKERIGRRKRGEGREIKKEEIEEQIKRLKTGKAAGENGLENEVWKNGGKRVIEEAWKICNAVWRGEGWPKGWEMGLIVPIKKKGEGRKVEDYRGITLMDTMAKVYAGVLGERIEKEMEEKGMIGEGVDRRKLWEVLERKGVTEELRKAIEGMYEETACKVRRGKETGEKFWVEKGVRQGCPMSAKLFIIYMAEMEERLEEKGKGGVRLGRGKVHCMMYADDVVLMAKEMRGMRLMLKTVEEFLDERGMELNVEKTKVVRFGKRVKGEVKCRWKEEWIEERKQVKYLGYRFRRNGRQEEHVAERIRKAGVVMREVWGIGKRMFRDNFERRIWLYDRMVWPVLEYGAEVWGWEERGRIEAMGERYLRWVMGVDWATPGYSVREECKREKMRMRAAKRAWDFEERLREGKGNRWARECLREIEERERKGGKRTRWEEERKSFMEERGKRRGGKEWGSKEERMKMWEDLEREEKKREEKERRERIGRSRYNRWYKEIMEEERPGYMKGERKEGEWKRLARYRMGNEMREGAYWRKEEERRWFRLKDNSFIVKEFAVLRDIKVFHILFSPPFSYSWLNEAEIKQANWLYYNHHGLNWTDGYSPYYRYKDVIKKYVINEEEQQEIFVKGLEKRNWLSGICDYTISNADECEWGDFKLKDSKDKLDLSMCMNHEDLCALKNIYFMKYMYEREMYNK